MRTARSGLQAVIFLMTVLVAAEVLSLGVLAPAPEATARKKAATLENFKKKIAWYLRKLRKRRKKTDPAKALTQYRKSWTGRACRGLKGNPRSECDQWYDEVMKDLVAGGDASKSLGPVPPPPPDDGTCPDAPTSAGFKRWVWRRIFDADPALKAQVEAVARYIAARRKSSSFDAQLGFLRAMFGELAARNSHPMSGVGSGPVKAMRKEAKLKRGWEKKLKQLNKWRKRQQWLQKILAKAEKRVKDLEAKLDPTRNKSARNQWVRGKLKTKLKTAKRGLWPRRVLKGLQAKISKTQADLDKQIARMCGAAKKYEAPYREALGLKRFIEYKKWFVATIEQKKLFDTDPGYLLVRRVQMSEPGPSFKARAIRLPSGLKGSGKFGPELIPFFEMIKNLIAKDAKAKVGPQFSFAARQYRTHSWGEYSADIWIFRKCPPGSNRVCFIPRDKLFSFFRAARIAGREKKVAWRALYNDFEVAKAFNKDAKRKHVRFQWIHGPGPYKDHIHMDMMPLSWAEKLRELRARQRKAKKGKSRKR